MPRIRFIVYSCLLGVGAALIGLVIGFLIKTPSSAVASILIVIGIGFVALAIFIARRFGGNQPPEPSPPVTRRKLPS
jgi:ABC-type Mn2+/Zn2+ transport system permease subunit